MSDTHDTTTAFRKDLAKLCIEARYRGLDEVAELMELARIAFEDSHADELARTALIRLAQRAQPAKNTLLN